jgi:hypothetical protein
MNVVTCRYHMPHCLTIYGDDTVSGFAAAPAPDTTNTVTTTITTTILAGPTLLFNRERGTPQLIKDIRPTLLLSNR